MKKIAVLNILLISFLAFILASCERDVDELRMRDAFVGSWRVVENTVPSSRDIQEAYIVNITPSPIFANEVEMVNFYAMGFDFKVPAVIENQEITINTFESDDYTFSGKGKLSNNQKSIEWVYTVEDPYGDKRTYNSEFTRL